MGSENTSKTENHDLPITRSHATPTPYTEIDTAVNGTQVRCEDVTFGCSRLQNVIKVTPFYYECEVTLLATLTRPTYFPDLHHFVFIS